eukprot:6419630-Heterocapsa_arctica.AAC.1
MAEGVVGCLITEEAVFTAATLVKGRKVSRQPSHSKISLAGEHNFQKDRPLTLYRNLCACHRQ